MFFENIGNNLRIFMRKTVFFFICLLVNPALGIKNFVLISAPGSGKGTFSQYLCEKHGYVQICPGDIFRREIKAQTELGKRVQSVVDQGDYVDEDTIWKIVKDNLINAIDEKKVFVIDGFPHSKVSLVFLYEYFKEKDLLDDVIFLQFAVDDAVCIKRVLNRQVCMNCYKVYNSISAPSKEKNKCECGADLSLRKTDTESIIKKRLAHFHLNIEPLLKEAKEICAVLKIEGEWQLGDLETEFVKLVS